MSDDKSGDEVTVRPEDLGKPGATTFANGSRSKDNDDNGGD